VVFGLSTLPPGDKQRIAELAKHLELHFFTLTPSSEWWQDLRRERAARRSVEPGELEAQSAHNAILAADGAPSRDLQAWLEDVGYTETDVELARAEPRSLLEALQRWIDEASDNPRGTRKSEASARAAAEGWDRFEHCDSVQIHACHGALRQCEALRDELLRRFAADPTLEPRHVLVMTPDVATYGPLVSAVFARQSSAPAIPLHVADLGIRSTNPVAEVLLQVLALGGERITASGAVALLGLAPLRARFGIADEELPLIEGMIVESGMRWGWDESDRARHEQPRLRQNTVRFGLERLALGVLAPDEGGLASVSVGTSDADGPIVPVDLATRDRVEAFGRLAELLARVEEWSVVLGAPGTVDGWRSRLADAVDALARVEGKAAWQRAQVLSTIDELLPPTPDGGVELELDRGAVEALLRGAFELPQRGDRPPTGAVTLSAFEPMRSVPFRVIALVGMDDGAFPRVDRPASWDPFAEAQPGEHDRRTIDRHLFLESLLCARDALLCFGTGFEPKRGDEAPMAVVVSELGELVETIFGLEPGSFPVRHPLQPWSAAAFAAGSPSAGIAGREMPVGAPSTAGSGMRRFALGYDAAWAEAATLLATRERIVAGLGATRERAQLPPDPEQLTVLHVADLARALAHPQEELLRRRLGLGLARRGVTVEDREPLELDTLENWSLRAEALEILRTEGVVDVVAWEKRLAGRGELPLRQGGRRAMNIAISEAARIVERLEGTGRREGTEPLTFSVSIDGLRLDATAPEVRVDDGGPKLTWCRSGKLRPRARLEGWLGLLVAAASGYQARRAALVHIDTVTELEAPRPEEAKDELRRLIALRGRARGGAIPLFPKVSFELAQKVKKRSDDGVARRQVLACRTLWEGDDFGVEGDRHDPWVGALYGELGIEQLADRADEVVALGMGLWGRCLEAELERTSAEGRRTKEDA
jgi:exodeoxyribonuclease V gamma subunit